MQNREAEKLLVVENLTMEYQTSRRLFEKKKPGVKAVNNVSFDVKKAKHLELLGNLAVGKRRLENA